MKRGAPYVDYTIGKDEFYERIIGALNKTGFKTKDVHPYDENAIYGIFIGEQKVSDIDTIGFCSSGKSTAMRVEAGSSLDKFLESYISPSMDDNGAM